MEKAAWSHKTVGILNQYNLGLSGRHLHPESRCAHLRCPQWFSQCPLSVPICVLFKIATYFKWAHYFGHCDFYQMGTLSFLMGTAVFQMGTHVFQMGTHVFQMGTQSSLADPCFTRNGHTLVPNGNNIPPNWHNVLPKWAHMFPQRGTSFLPSGHHWAHGHKPSPKHFLRY